MCLYLPLYIVGKRGKEVYTRDALNLIDRINVMCFSSVAFLVSANKTHSLGSATETEDDLEECLRYPHLAIPYRDMLLPCIYRAADDIDITVPTCPIATLYLNLIPNA